MFGSRFRDEELRSMFTDNVMWTLAECAPLHMMFILSSCNGNGFGCGAHRLLHGKHVLNNG